MLEITFPESLATSQKPVRLTKRGKEERNEKGHTPILT